MRDILASTVKIFIRKTIGKYFQNKKNTQKLTQTSYVNRKDHWLLFLKNPAQIRR